MTAFFLQGYDDHAGEVVYWTWTDPDHRDHIFVQDRAVLDAAMTALRLALPGEDAELASLDLTELNERLIATNLPETLTDWLRDNTTNPATNFQLVLTYLRVADGALGSRDTERALAHTLGQALLPPELVTALRAHAAEGGIPDADSTRDRRERPRLTVLPARSCSAVPWAWLGTGGSDGSPDERLVELADVVTMGPALHRDGQAVVPHPSWEDRRNEPLLYVVDPAGGDIPSVLRCDAGVDQDQLWRAAVDAARAADTQSPGLVRSQAATREWLFRELKGHSAVLFLGHVVCASDEGDAPSTGVSGNSGAGRVGLLLSPALGAETADTLTAADIVLSLLATPTRLSATGAPTTPVEYAAATRHTAESHLARDPGLTADALLTDDIPVATGRGYAAPPHPWSWPPRVGLVACQSGSDLSFPEPFGLVTAILEAGAELVLATLWPLFTDTMFLLGSGADAEDFTETPLFDLALATRGVLTSATPIEDFGDWQRARLADWRASPSLTRSPLVWAAAALHYAPDRTPRLTG